MLEISADYTDYPDFGSGLCRTVRQKNLYWWDARFDLHGRHRSRGRNLRNLRIFNFVFSPSAVPALCLNNLRFT
jgi:hypothetical protein